jgi:hypothetical protein
MKRKASDQLLRTLKFGRAGSREALIEHFVLEAIAGYGAILS